ncbi:MAG TPA: cobyrinate a,c-diamide synthase [Paracoccaceae bacterium]|nr:cobyrinate a,c-diamide synthase [Paracoccaceae bacterium]
MTHIPRIMIAAAHKSSGKTVVTTGLAAALKARGQNVAVFKKGPDYIDPMWLSRAAGRPAYNLDFNTMSRGEISGLFARKALGSDISLIEANKGLFDGVAADGSDSNAEIAKLLGAPVVLVIDTSGTTRGIAPLLLGYRAFDPEVQIAGVILNRTGGSRHESKLRAAVETYTDIEVLGAVGANALIGIPERHLGLTTPTDTGLTDAFVRKAGETIGTNVDLDRLMAIAASAPPIAAPEQPEPTPHRSGLRIGVAMDEAFGFYYPDDLDAFRALGAEVVPIDMIRDPHLPQIDGLFIGGGFPEVHAAALSANASMRESVKSALEAGLPAYAECGGLMYLCRTLSWHGQTHPMAGFFDAATVMQERPQGRGHVRFSPSPSALWPMSGPEQKAHEFHYARLEDIDPLPFARQVTRGHGIDGKHDALVKANTQAGFIHLRNTAQSPWVANFLEFVARKRPKA